MADRVRRAVDGQIPGAEIDVLPAEYRWEAPDGTSILAHHLGEGYFGAAGLPEDPISAAVHLQKLGDGLAARRIVDILHRACGA